MIRKFGNLVLAALTCAGTLSAQRLVDWPTYGGDAQRTGWQKTETKISRDNLKGFQLLWKLKFDNQPKALHSLLGPLILGNVITNRGFKEMAIVAGSSDNIYAVDADLGKMLWKRHFDYSSDKPQIQNSSWLCPGGLTATPVITPMGVRRRTPQPALSPVPGPPPSAGGGTTAAPARRAAPAGGGPFGVRSVYVVSSDGMLHQLSVANGEELTAPAKFMPPNGKPYSLNMADDVIYATTAQGCGGNPNGVYSLDLESPDKKVTFLPSKGGGIWGLGGAPIGTDGTVYAEVGDGPWDPADGKYSDTAPRPVSKGSKDQGLLHTFESRMDHQEGPGYE